MVAIHNNSCTPQVLDKQRLIWKRAINYFVCWSFVLSQKTNCQKDRKRRRKKQSIGTQGKICNFFIQFKFGPKFSIAWFFVWNLISTRKVLLAKTINVYFKKKKKIQLNSWCCLVDGHILSWATELLFSFQRRTFLLNSQRMPFFWQSKMVCSFSLCFGHLVIRLSVSTCQMHSLCVFLSALTITHLLPSHLNI